MGGGDCCGPNVDKTFCSVCACLEDTGVPNHCFKQDYKGDAICDDGNNNAGCDFDGGDCCLPNVDKTFCKECACLEGPGDRCFKEDYKVMEFVMMEIIMLGVTMMEETVVDRMWKKHSAQCVPVLKGLELAKRPNTKVIEFVMMEIIMLGVTMMEEIVVDPMWTKHSALNVPVRKAINVLIISQYIYLK